MCAFHYSTDAHQRNEVDTDYLDGKQPCPSFGMRPANQQRQKEEKAEEHRHMFDVTRWKAVRAQAAERRHMHTMRSRTSDETIDDGVDEVGSKGRHGDRHRLEHAAQHGEDQHDGERNYAARLGLVGVAGKIDEGRNRGSMQPLEQRRDRRIAGELRRAVRQRRHHRQRQRANRPQQPAAMRSDMPCR